MEANSLDLIDCPRNLDHFNRLLCDDAKCSLYSECRHCIIRDDSADEEVKEYYFNGKFSPAKLGIRILAENRYLTIRDSDEVYIYKDGYYQSNGESYIREVVRRRLKDEWKNHYSNEIVEYVKSCSFAEREELDQPVNLICMQNGVFNLESLEITDHTPDIYFTRKIPIHYDPEAKCEGFDEFLSEILPDEKDQEAVRQLFGYCLYSGYPIQKAFILNGDGSNGKSTLLGVLKSFLGRENCVSRSLHELEGPRSTFNRAELHGKLANIIYDLSSKSLSSTSVFKALTGGDLISAEKKFQSPFSFVNKSKIIAAGNRLPEISDESDAFYRRLIIITFPCKFENDRANKNLINILTTPEELSGVFNEAIEGLRKLLMDGNFSNDKSTDEMRDLYMRRSDSVKSFVLDELEVDLQGHILKQDLYLSYVKYCVEENYSALSEVVFNMKIRGKTVEALGLNLESSKLRVEGIRAHSWRGITYKSEESKEEEREKRRGLEKYA
jgi:phage/plasmid primase, P4 family, C-terminal domain